MWVPIPGATRATLIPTATQTGFPSGVALPVTEDTGSWTLGRVVLGTR